MTRWLLIPHAVLLLAVLASPLHSTADDDAAKKGETPRPRLVLLDTQLLETPGGYPAFCTQHATADRRTLRTETIARLKAMAEKTQPAVRKALGNPEDVRSLWLVNALVLPLTPSQEKAAGKLPGVKAVYPAGMLPALDKKPGKLKEVLPRPKKRKPWKLGKKEVPWNLTALQVPKVWSELGVTGKGVVIAMFDSGINYLHEDLRRRMWRNPKEKPNNGKDDDGNGLVDDLHGWHFPQMTAEVDDRSPPRHGSLTSSVAAGDGTGGIQTGVAPEAQLMALLGFGGPYNAARAFQYALEQGADICSMSFSIPGLGHTRGVWRMMAENASAAGLVLVSGAGNFGSGSRRAARIPVQIRIPEGIPCVICIGGVKRDLSVPAFVSLGPVEWGSVRFYEDHPMPNGLIKPDVVAFPGPGIALIDGYKDKGYLPANNKRRGNSLSAPHAAGVLALMLEARPSLPPWRLKAILEETAKDLETEGKDRRSGAGLIDAFAAVKRARDGAPAVTGSGTAKNR